ncbi:hypothetical protein B0A50_08305 [Salinomyces thailandicus]|uniref:Early meiotic induction protein 1 n=1 Tax=Salinomyces thailandicus TaxID=706561 RepID=A0A4U0TK07_9PEZI|nr:hypothetical protein B0A50_08305 [Salinomyces thailandica]
MGWLWSSSPSATSSDPTQTTNTTLADADPAEQQRRTMALTDDQRERIFGRPNAQSTTGPRSRDQQADAELENWLNSISGSSSSPQPTSSHTPPTSTPISAEPAPPIVSASRYHPDGSLDISPSALAPRTMSCRQAFDQAFYCQSVGGKFNDIYRYGHLTDCKEQWGAFWFCMRNRTLPGRDKEQMIAQYYLDRDEKRKRERGSSEDVWELRTKAVDKAFWKDPDADDGDEGMMKE